MVGMINEATHIFWTEDRKSATRFARKLIMLALILSLVEVFLLHDFFKDVGNGKHLINDFGLLIQISVFIGVVLIFLLGVIRSLLLGDISEKSKVGYAERSIKFCGFEIFREKVQDWKELHVDEISWVFFDTPWSWSIAAPKNSSLELYGVDVIEVAIWFLLAKGFVRAKCRKEITFIFGRNRGGSLRTYFYTNELHNIPNEGYWEKTMLREIQKWEKETPLELEEWVVQAYGEQKSTSPQREVISRMGQEFVEKGWASYKWFLSSKIKWIKEPEKINQFNDIRDYINRHDSKIPGIRDSIRSSIIAALNNRTEISSD
jgi:hypothetical protein